MSQLRYKKLIIEVSDKTFGNMSFVKGDPGIALNNRKKFLSSLGIHLNEVTVMAPIHRGRVIEVTKRNLNSPFSKKWFQADGMITKDKGVFLFLSTGDCIPICVYDPKNQAVGLIHGGIASLESGAVINTIKAMQQRFNSDPKNLAVWFGPSIGPCCYLKAYPKEISPVLEPFTKIKEQNLVSIDIWSFAHSQLISLGIPQGKIDNPKVCTYHSNSHFSHRKAVVEKLKTDYRFATVIGIQESKKLPKISSFQEFSQIPLQLIQENTELN